MENRERTIRGNGAHGYDSRTQARARLSATDLRDLIELMKVSDIEEITIEHETSGLRLTLRKPAPVTAATVIPAGAAADMLDLDDAEELTAAQTAEQESRAKRIEVRAPLVGIFRSSMKGDGKAMVGPDDLIRPGQVVGAIEALNVLNEVEAGVAGRVQKVCVEDGEPVEYGQTLLEIEPATASS
jgi:acetyl-CoA carboxylase biotin carboxyl carrier protein